MTIKKNVPAKCSRNVVKVIIICLAYVDAAAVADEAVMEGVAAKADAAVMVVVFAAQADGEEHGAHMVLNNHVGNADHVGNVFDTTSRAFYNDRDVAGPEHPNRQK